MRARKGFFTNQPIRMKMQQLGFWSSATDVYLDLTFPERVLGRQCRSLAYRYPRLALVIEVIVSTILGTLKVVTFPLSSFAGVVLLPLKGIFLAIKNRDCTVLSVHFTAGLLSLLVSALIVSAIYAAILLAPEVVFCMIGVAGACGASATLLHLHQALFGLPTPLHSDNIRYLS